MYEKLNRFEKVIFDAGALILVLFYSYAAVIKPMATQYHKGVYVLITYVLVFLVYKNKHLVLRIIDYLLILLSMASIGYWMYMFEEINYRVGAETNVDMVFAVIGVLIGIELARRVVGNVFVILGVLMLIYGVYGSKFPELFEHAGAPFTELCISIFYKGDGIFGIMANVLATYVILFVLFGAFLEKCGAQKFFIDWPLAAVGHRVGGPAKVSVIASGLFGSISGSAIANTVSTGMFTIPMMKKAGFRPHIAGGIEPAASIGGMFMPPIMGAGGFIMAEMTGRPYSEIMLVAIFPAVMYFFSVFCMVHFEAKRYNIVGERTSYSAMEIFKKQWFYVIPLLVITAFMLKGFSPGYSAILGLVSCIFISWVDKERRMDLTLAFVVSSISIVSILNSLISKNGDPVIPEQAGFIIGFAAAAAVYIKLRSKAASSLVMFVKAAREGTENSLKIGATVGIIGIIIGVLTFSGVILDFADIMIELAGGRLLITIFLVALASLILGMGVPVTAAYLITAVVAVPALEKLGVNQLAAHMIVYWLSQDSNITPPVCIAAFAGATIAKAPMWKTAFTSFKFAKFLYLGPLLFGYVPEFSLNGEPMEIFNGSIRDIVVTFVMIMVGTYVYSYVLSGIWLDQMKSLVSKIKGA